MGDYDKACGLLTSAIPEGTAVIGFIRTSDAGTGDPVVRVFRGSRLWGRAEPKAPRQKIEILGQEARSASHTVASTAWMLLKFSSRPLPDTFDVRFYRCRSRLGRMAGVCNAGE